MRAILKMMKFMDKEFTYIMMENNIKEDLLRDSKMDLENSFIQMEKYMRENGDKAKCMDEDSSCGLMAKNLLEFIKMILNKDMGSCILIMEISLRLIL